MEEVVAQSPLQIEDDGQAGEIARGILNRAVGRVVLGDIQLGQFDFRINDQRIRQIPNEHQVVVRVGDCKENPFVVLFCCTIASPVNTNLRLSIIMEQYCVSCGYDSNFMAQLRTSVSLDM